MLLDPLTQQGTAGIGQRIWINVACCGAAQLAWADSVRGQEGGEEGDMRGHAPTGGAVQLRPKRPDRGLGFRHGTITALSLAITGSLVSDDVFTPQERERLREVLVAAAAADARITGAAVTGSAAVGRDDRWSDIDLAWCLATDADLERVLAEWTDRMYGEHAAVHHVDVTRGLTVYRVFLLANTLQVDLAFWPAAEFGAIAPTFRLLFGTANHRPPAPAPQAAELIGMGWLYALHARSSMARGRVWQAEYMISGVRDHVLALACLRQGVPAVQGRGMDSLPRSFTAALTGALVRSLEIAELRRAFRVISEALLVEIGQVDADLASRLASPIRELAS